MIAPLYRATIEPNVLTQLHINTKENAMSKTLPAPKLAARLGVGKVFIPRIMPSKDSELPRSRDLAILESTLKGALRRAADLRSQIHAPVFGVETVDTDQLQTELEWRLEYAEHARRVLLPRIHNYPILSAEPLTWRDEQGFPKLVIVPIDRAGEVEVSANRDRWHYRPIGTGSDVDYGDFGQEIITPCYESVGEVLRKQAPYGGLISIKTTLNGLLMPKKTREKIAAARAHFGKQIFLIAEAPQPWEINVVVPPKPDPLVVGYENGLLFLIDTFNMTRIERVVAAEYTLG